MSRLGVLYAVNDEELNALYNISEDERYDFMLEEIEPNLFDTPNGYELDKAWEGIQYCLGGGQWNEDNVLPLNIVFAGEFVVDSEDSVITLKTKDEVRKIADYLEKNDIQTTIAENFAYIPSDNYTLPKDENNLLYLQEWSKGLGEFYKHAAKENRNVIFTVDL